MSQGNVDRPANGIPASVSWDTGSAALSSSQADAVLLPYVPERLGYELVYVDKCRLLFVKMRSLARGSVTGELHLHTSKQMGWSPTRRAMARKAAQQSTSDKVK